MKHEHSTLSSKSLELLSIEKSRRIRIRFLYLFLALGGAALLIAVAAMFIDWKLGFQSPVWRFLLTMTAFGSLMAILKWVWGKMKFKSDQAETAKWLDEVNPALQERLTTSVELKDSTNHSPELLKAVGEQVDDFKIKSGGTQLVKSRSFTWAGVTFAASIALLLTLIVITGQSFPKLWDRLVHPWNDNSLTLLTQNEGEVFHPRGQDFSIAVAISGKIPVQAKIQERSANGSIEERWVDIDKNTGYVSYIVSKASEDFSYRIEAGDAQIDWQKVSIIDKPSIVSAQIKISPPAYTKLAPWTLTKLPRQLKIPQGSQVDFKIKVDQEILQATFDKRIDRKVIQEFLTRSARKTYIHNLSLADTIHADLKMTSKVGNLSSKFKISLISLADKAPKVRLLKETETFAMKADEKLDVKFQATDDYGVEAAQLVAEVTNPDGTKESFSFPIDLAYQKGTKKLESSVSLDLSKLPIKKGSKLTYIVEVTDSRGAASFQASQPLSQDELEGERRDLQRDLAQIKQLEEKLRNAKEVNEKALSNGEFKPNRGNQKQLTQETQEHLSQARKHADQLQDNNTRESLDLKNGIDKADQKLEDSKTAQDPTSDLKASEAEIDKARKALDEMRRQLEGEIAKNKADQENSAIQQLKQQKAELQQAITKIGDLKNQLTNAESSNKEAIKAQIKDTQQKQGQNGDFKSSQKNGQRSQAAKDDSSTTGATAKTRRHLEKANQSANSLAEGAQSQWKDVKTGIAKAQKSLGNSKSSNVSSGKLREIGNNIRGAQTALNRLDQEVKKAVQKIGNQLSQQSQLKQLRSALSAAKQQANSIRQKISGQQGQQALQGLQRKNFEDLSDRVDDLQKMAQELDSDPVKDDVSQAIAKTKQSIEQATGSSNSASQLQQAEEQIDKAINAIGKAQEKSRNENNRPSAIPPAEKQVKKRKLDITQNQPPSKSKPAEVVVDEYAQHFLAGDGLKKKQIAIQEVLDEILKNAQKGRQLTAKICFNDALKEKNVARTGEGLKKASREVSPKLIVILKNGVNRAEQLRKLSADTPYSFFGLQSKAMVENGFLPAIKAMEEALNNPKPDLIKEKLDSIDERLRWVIALLKKTESQFESMIKMEEIADLTHKFKKMHTLTIEDMPPGGT